MAALTKMSGQITITTAGTAIQGAAVRGKLFAIQGVPGNTGLTYVGNDGADDVTAANGFPLPKIGPGVVIEIGDLSDLWFDSASNGDKVAWLRLAA